MSTSCWEDISRLSRNRPRSRSTEIGWWLFALLLIAPWLFYDFSVYDLFKERRLANASRFLGELVPYPIAQDGFSTARLLSWTSELFFEKGFIALQYSLAISVLSVLIAAVMALFLSFFSSRQIYFNEYLEIQRKIPLGKRAVVFGAKLIALFYRAIPEYIWTFILVILIGVSPWPAVIALAIHNCGILAKLFAETVDDLEIKPLESVRLLGGRPTQVGLFAALPMALNRFMLFFFVRWETCVRESTVIGFLGIVSIGYWIEDARARNFYDQLFFFVLLGTILVFIGDIFSSIVRAQIRKH